MGDVKAEIADNGYSSSKVEGAANLSETHSVPRQGPGGGDAAGREGWFEVEWNGWSAGGRHGARCDQCGRLVNDLPFDTCDGAGFGRLWELSTNGEQTLRCNRPECAPSESYARFVATEPEHPIAADLAVDAPRVAPRVVADPGGAVDSWLEARDAARDGAPRVARPLYAVPDPGLAQADDRPRPPLTPEIDDEGRDLVYQSVGVVASATELAKLLVVELVAHGPAGDPRRIMAALVNLHEATIGALTVASVELGVSLPDHPGAVVICGECLDNWDPKHLAYWFEAEGRPEPCQACGRLTEYRGLRIRR